MDKTNLELFKQALTEGLSNKFDTISNSYPDEVICSEKHNIAMRTIVSGKCESNRKLSPRARRLIAILVAAALILTGCFALRGKLTITFENGGIRFSSSNSDNKGYTLGEIYKLSYVPEGYTLDSESITDYEAYYTYCNSEGQRLEFQQLPSVGSSHSYDNENSTTTPIEINNVTVYYTEGDIWDFYLWSDGEYTFQIASHVTLSVEELNLLLGGLSCD